jgi:hypothetical protein
MLCAFLALSFLPFGSGTAQADALAACSGESVTGTVVAVDADSGVVVIETRDGELCTVIVAPDDDHPVVSLLGRYFGNVSAEDLDEALAVTEVWVVCAVARECALADEDDEGAVAARVVDVTENADGTFTLELAIEPQDDTFYLTTADEDLAGEVGRALELLAVEWVLVDGDDGPVVVDASAKIVALHEDGMGFGVIVKLYAIAAASQEDCDDGDDETCVNVDELVVALQSGTGLGQLFKEHGKPALSGVGHVRKTAAPTPRP